MKKKKNTKEESKKFLRTLSYVMLFYFGIRLILIPLVFAQGEGLEFMGWFNVVLNILIVLFGLYASFNIKKYNKWALTSVIVLLIVQIISGIILTASLGNIRFPIVQLAFVIMAIAGYNHLRLIEEK